MNNNRAEPGSSLERVGLHCLLSACLGLLLFDNIKNIGQPEETIEKAYIIGRFSAFDFATGILAFLGFYKWQHLKRDLHNGKILIAASLIVFAAIHGVLRNASILADIRLYVSLFSGVVLGYALLKSGSFIRYLVGYTAALGALLIYAANSTEMAKAAVVIGKGAVRVTDLNIYYYWGSLLLPCGILGTVIAVKRPWAAFVFATAMALLFYYGAIVTATRSCLITQAVLTMLIAISWLKRRGAKFTSALGIIVAGAVIVPIGLFVAQERVLHGLSEAVPIAILERAALGGSGDENLHGRFEEVGQLLTELSPWEYLTGRGFGGSIIDKSGRAERQQTFHLAAFNVLLKFGVLVFALFLTLILFALPKAFIAPGKNAPRAISASAAICYPAVGAFTALIFMSGGFSEIAFLWLGVIYAMHRAIISGDGSAMKTFFPHWTPPPGRSSSQRHAALQRKMYQVARRSHEGDQMGGSHGCPVNGLSYFCKLQ